MTNPFDFVNSITHNKRDLLAEQPDLITGYVPYIVNRALSLYPDTILAANEMNRLAHLDRDMQYRYYINIVRAKKRFAPWPRKEQSEDIQAICEYYNCNTTRAREALAILTDQQVQDIKQQLDKGGVNE